MKMKLLVGLFILFLLFLPQTFADATNEANPLNSVSFKVTVLIKGEEIEWEFENPDDYELEKGNRVMKGQKAQKEVEHIFKLLDVNEEAKVEQMVSVMKEKGYVEMERLDVRWINADGELYTWIWEKE